MKLFKSSPFQSDDKEYEIRIYYDERAINVLAFRDDFPANGYRYQVKIPKACSPENVLSLHSVPELVAKCKNDIQEKTWDSLSKSIQQSSID